MLLDHLPGIYARMEEHYKGRGVAWSIMVTPMHGGSSVPMLKIRVERAPSGVLGHVMTGSDSEPEAIAHELEEMLRRFDELLFGRQDLATQGRAWP